MHVGTVNDAVRGLIVISDKSFFPKGGGEYFVTVNIATHIEWPLILKVLLRKK